MPKTAHLQHWSKDQVSMFAKDLRRGLGEGWKLLVPRLQRAVVAEKVYHVCSGQVAATVEVSAMDELHRELCRELGVE